MDVLNEGMGEKMNAVVLQMDASSDYRLRIVYSNQVSAYEELSAFIKAVYWQRYGATQPTLLPVLVALESNNGELLATCGLSFGSESSFFLEQYLDKRVETLIAQKIFYSHLARRHIVEVGNLCSAKPGGGRLMIMALCERFCELGLQWVVFTGTNQLRNSFSRLGIDLLVLAKADPTRLKGTAEGWGRYYHSQPQVMAGNVRANHMRLQSADHNQSKHLLPFHLDVISGDATD